MNSRLVTKPHLDTVPHPSPLIPVFTDPELVETAEFLYGEGFAEGHLRLASDVFLRDPQKPMRGTSPGDPAIMLSSIFMWHSVVIGGRYSSLDLVCHVVRTQARIIRNNIQNQDDEFLLVLDPESVVRTPCVRFRSPRFSDRVLQSSVVATLSEIDEIDELTFRDKVMGALQRHRDLNPAQPIRVLRS